MPVKSQTNFGLLTDDPRHVNICTFTSFTTECSTSVDIASVGTGGRIWASVKFFTHSSQEVKTVSIKQLCAFKITFLAYHYIPKI